MKTKMKEKLNSQSGVSFLFGLLTFMVAAVVSAMIVSAAATTMKRIHNDRIEQQETLTLTSATQFLRDEMLKTKHISTLTTKKNAQGVIQSEVSGYIPQGIFASEMKAAVEMVNSGISYISDPSAITIDIEGLNLQTVKASFTMSAEESEESKKYQVIFTVYLDNSGKTMFLTMSGDVGESSNDSTSDGITTSIKTTTISWKNPVISSVGE